MKITLVNAPWHEVYDESGFLGIRAGSRWPHTWDFAGSMVNVYRPFIFFMATAAALLKNNGYDVVVRDSIVMGEKYDEFYDFIIKESPDVYFMEISTPSIENDLKIIRTIKSKLPNTKIVVAGIHADIQKEQFLENYEFIDFTICGEYEITLLNLMNAITNHNDLKTVKNILYRDELGNIAKTTRENLNNINILPWPERDSLPGNYLDNLGVDFEEPQLQITTSRGCPYQCNFCAWPQIMYQGPYYRTRDPQDVVNEILYNLKKVDYKSIYIDDDTININKNHILELCRLFMENGINKIKWGCMGRADLMDDEILHALKDAGCHAIKYGAESFNQDIINACGKKMNVEKNVRNILKTKELGIKVYLTFAIGLPGDTKETIEDTINRALDLPVDAMQFSIATPYPGSELYRIYETKGWIDKNCNKYDARKISIGRTETLSAEELEELRRNAENRHVIKRAETMANDILDNLRKTEIKNYLKNGYKILVLQSAPRMTTKAVLRFMNELEKDVYLLTHEKFMEELKDELDDNNIITFNHPASFNLPQMTSLINELRKYDFDYIIVPTGSSMGANCENIYEVAKQIKDKVVIVTRFGQLILEENSL